MSEIRLGTAPITWGVCELPGWGEELPYCRVLTEMQQAGYEGTELGPWGYLPTDPAALRRELATYGLELIGSFCPVTLYDPERAEASLAQATETARLLADLGAHVLVVADAATPQRLACAGRVRPEDGLSEEQWRRLAGGLETLAQQVQGLGLRAVFHPHAGTYVETSAEVDRLMELVAPEAVGLCLDTGHLAFGGADPVELCRRYAARVWHVHAKDIRADVLERARREGMDFPAAVGAGVFVPLGQGSVDFPALIGALRAAGYRGWIVVEQDVRLGPQFPPTNPLDNAKISKEYIEKVLRSV